MQASTRPSTSVAQAIAQSAALSDRAILVGNRAGVVEWANDAWTRLTGFPIGETISKPITHFLEQAHIELELVDFVAQHFREGQSCEIEFPFETFDERTIHVHLEVQPIRNATNEIVEFVAIATDATFSQEAQHARDATTQLVDADQPLKTHAGESAPAEQPLGRSPLPNIQRVSVSAIAEIATERFARRQGPRTHFDVSLGKRLPSVRTNRILLEELVGLMLESAFYEIDESWGFVSVSTGRAPEGRRFGSAVHGMNVFLPEAAQFAQYIEVHDTGATLSDAALDAIRLGVRLADPRSQRLATAAALAPALGAAFLVDSTPGCGTQALLLLPA